MKKRMKEYTNGKQASIFNRAIRYLGIEGQSGDDVVNDLTVHVGEAVVATRVTVG